MFKTKTLKEGKSILKATITQIKGKVWWWFIVPKDSNLTKH